MKRWIPSWKQIYLSGFAIFFLFCASHFLTIINIKREEYNLTHNPIMDNAPPELVLATTALGGLRGFLIDYLWLRVLELRNQGNHYEVIHLYNLIGKLEPRIPEVWILNSSEMAYNISITMPTPHDKWRWVYKGIEHLRDHGLKYNQNSAKLYQQLGFLIFNKLELNSMDVYKDYYQKRWFDIWAELLDDTTDLDVFIQAPQQFQEIKNNGQWQQLLQITKKLNISLAENMKWKDFPKTVHEEIEQNKELLHTWNIFKNYLIQQRINQDLKMDLQRMKEIDNNYCKLDWRLPASHSFYWGEIAFEKMDKSLIKVDSSSLHTHIQILRYNSLKQIFEYGTFLANTDLRIVCTPNFNIVESLDRTYLEVQDLVPELGKENYQDFLEHVIKTCYLYNQKERADKYFQKVKEKFTSPLYTSDLDNFVIREIGRSINFERKHIVENYITIQQRLAYQAILNGMLDHYNGLTRFIYVLHKQYLGRHTDTHLLEIEQPKPLKYFQQAAIQWIKQNLEQRVGQEKAQQVWNNIIKKYPLLNLPSLE
ncbi:MAG: hypothetical protein KBC30_09555 [Planctomycetes bacterium]|jgi:hypothetical protein|nr:hypothetical protein [Planctomycetota bacterium]HPY75930.1 hypothetical protein [Planctomycetota bacterium]HQB01475.1 hypothetical protein [Planctomycetota bacterium]